MPSSTKRAGPGSTKRALATSQSHSTPAPAPLGSFPASKNKNGVAGRSFEAGPEKEPEDEELALAASLFGAGRGTFAPTNPKSKSTTKRSRAERGEERRGVDEGSASEQEEEEAAAGKRARVGERSGAEHLEDEEVSCVAHVLVLVLVLVNV